MVIFFIVILSIITAVPILITCSSLKINVKELIIINTKIDKFKIILSLNLFGKIKWIQLTLDNKRLQDMKSGTKLKLFNKILDTKILRKYKNAKQILKNDWKHVLKNLNKFNIANINLVSKIGTENPAITAISVGAISAIISIVLNRKVENPKYKIEPIYINKNHLYLSINCIITIKLVHIININRKLGKEVYQEYGGTSNRRTYANCNG